MNFAVSGLLQPRLLVQSCFYKYWSGSVLVEVLWSWSHKGLWLRSTLLEVPDSAMPIPKEVPSQAYSLKIPDSCLDPQRSLVPANSHRSSILTPGPAEVLAQDTPSKVPDSQLDLQKSWLRPSSLEGPDSCMDPQSSLVPAQFLCSCFTVPAPAEFTVSCLLWHSPLAQSRF